MGRKRKVPALDEEKENNEAESTATSQLHGPMYTIMSNVQLNETFHNRYIKEMKLLYGKMGHDAFFFTFVKMVKAAMEAEENNEYAHTTLLFCAKFITSYDTEDTHPLLVETSKWLLTTISNNPHVRFRLCQFVNMILNALGQEAALDDVICDNISDYMLERLRDVSPSVRVQAILAMQRLQVPDNPDDVVLRAYQFHLCSDPSPRVRQAVITCMGRNYHTIPYILDRLWDIDEKVRRHTYLHMSSYPVRSYKVSQRLMLLEQGLNDRSEVVRKVVTTVMLKQWIEAYQKNLIALVSALKLDSNEAEICRFRKITKQTLKEIFRNQSNEDLLKCLPVDEDGKYHRCVSLDKLTIEIAFFWQCLTDYLQSEMAEEFDVVVPELSVFCAYVDSFCQLQTFDMDKFELMEFQYTLLSLMEILYIYDLGDETGRGNLQNLLANILKNINLDEKVIEICIRCGENLITDQNTRLQFFLDIIQDICGLNVSHETDLVHNRALIYELLSNSPDANMNLKLSSLKVKILDLEEQEMNFKKQCDYAQAHQVGEERTAVTAEYMKLLKPLMDKYTGPLMLNEPKTVKTENIMKSLQITFHMVVSSKVQSLTPSVCSLYKDFICRHIASNQIVIRDWALKCGTAFSMLYDVLAKDVFDELYSQFFKNHNIRIWQTAITCIFELLDRYGIETFTAQEQQVKSKKTARQLYNTLEFLDVDDETMQVSSMDQGVGVIYMMSHFLDTCDDVCILSAIIKGFCRLVLHDHATSSEIVEKLLLRYFNPVTDPEIHQILGVFLENLIERKKHYLLESALLPTITCVLGAPYDSPLHDIRPETIMRFVIDSTRQDEAVTTSNSHVHNKLAQSILKEMLSNASNKEMCKLLAKELVTLNLNVSKNEQMRHEMREATTKLIKSDFDSKSIKYLSEFKSMVNGVYRKPHSVAETINESDEEGKTDDETSTTKDDDGATITDDGQRSATMSTVGEVVNESTLVDATLVPTDSALQIETEQATLATADNTSEDTTTNDKQLSPSVVAMPTTFGPNNVIDHRFLRKSLHLSRSQSSDTEVREVEGPTRPKEIRIEARIDSDKKATTPPRTRSPQTTPNSQKSSPPQRVTRARRNLNYKKVPSKESNVDNVTTPSKQTQTKQTRPPSTKTPIQVVPAEKEVTPVRTRTAKTPSSTRTNRINGSLNKSHLSVTPTSISPIHTPKRHDKLNDSDIIPPSPERQLKNTNQSNITTSRMTTRRLRQRAATVADATLIAPVSPRKSAATAEHKSPSITASKTRATTPVDVRKTLQSPPSDITPLRNGRKRILKPNTTKKTASASQKSNASDSELSCCLSPVRKQPCMEKQPFISRHVNGGEDGGGKIAAYAKTMSQPKVKITRIPRSQWQTQKSEQSTIMPLHKRAPEQRSISTNSSSDALSTTNAKRPKRVGKSRIPVPSNMLTMSTRRGGAIAPAAQRKEKKITRNTRKSSSSSTSSSDDELYAAAKSRLQQGHVPRAPSTRGRRSLTAKLTRMNISCRNNSSSSSTTTSPRTMRLRKT